VAHDLGGEEFVDDLPDPIREAIVKAGSTDQQDPESGEWLNGIAAKFRARFRRVRLVFKPGAKKKGTFGEGGVVLSGIHAEAPESWRRGMNFTTPVGASRAYAATLVDAALNRRRLPHY
jgi:hypothetical protein